MNTTGVHRHHAAVTRGEVDSCPTQSNKSADSDIGCDIHRYISTDVETDAQRTARVFAELKNRYGTRAQTAIRYALANPGVSGVLVGIAELDQIDEALAAVELGPLPQEALQRLERLYASDFDLGATSGPRRPQHA